jgi:CheY-like chemotaxis protein
MPIEVDISKVRILIVEGNAIHRRVLEEQVSSWGCVSLAFQNAGDAIATEEPACDIAIIDAHLSDMNGLDLGPLLRRKQHGERLGLIVLTSIGRRGDAKTAELAGFNAYLVKPVRQMDLRDAIGAIRQAQISGTLDGIVTRHSLAEKRGHSSSKHRKKTDRQSGK